MSIGKAILMGIVQGLTEFLPVSSSGHLAIVKCMFKADTETGILFDVLLHVATLVAVCAVYYKDILRLILEFAGMVTDIFENVLMFFKSKGKAEKKSYRTIVNSPYRKFVVLLIVTTIPTGIIGVLMSDVVESASSTIIVPGICLICTAVMLMISDYLPEGGKKSKTANYGDAFSIGVAQGIATLPGVSRSGTSITACLLCGFDRKYAVKYSFIMSIPAIIGALIMELTKIDGEHITGSDVGCYLVGMIFAAIVGYIALRVTIKIVSGRFFKWFAYYCAAVGIISIIVYIVTL